VRQERRQHARVKRFCVGVGGLCFLLEVLQVGRESGILSFPAVGPTVYRFMVLFLLLWSGEHCVPEMIRKEMSFISPRKFD
jgi:hypothetical protein